MNTAGRLVARQPRNPMTPAATSNENATTVSIQSNNNPSQVALQILLSVQDKAIGSCRLTRGVGKKPAAGEPARGLNRRSVRIAAITFSSWL
jgi:hypothetical protein